MPIISADEALTILRRGDGQTTQPITATGVTLGTADFTTDRGIAKLPAWLFTFPNFTQPVAVIAVAAPALFAPGDTSPNDSTLTARIDTSGTNITVAFEGAAGGDGPCTADYHLTLIEHDTYVDAFTPMTRSTDGTCTAVAYRREETATLERPLAGRVLVDAATGAAITVDKG